VLRDADTAPKRFRLIMDVAHYVLNAEGIVVTDSERADIVRRIYSNLFGYGVLDALLADPLVTTIAIQGAQHIAVRYGHGELVAVDAQFDDRDHLRQIVARLLRDAGIEWRDDLGIFEVGMQIAGRHVALNIAAPPVTLGIVVDIRLHPAQPPSLAQLAEQGWMLPEAQSIIEQIVRSSHGFIVIGEPETGKTTLTNALLELLAEPTSTVLIERSGEMRPPSAMTQLRTQWATDSTSYTSFGTQIDHALHRLDFRPTCLVLDEIRADEPETIAPLLLDDHIPRQIWAVRGVADAKRLQSALGMLARRSAPQRGEAPVHALYERLPFVITLARIQGQLKVFSIAEWQSRVDSEYPDYVMLFQYQDGAARPTGKISARWMSTE
jgi:type IV secretory pathway ATPase VirB11/archaellum biosynthesis ATPase